MVGDALLRGLGTLEQAITAEKLAAAWRVLLMEVPGMNTKQAYKRARRMRVEPNDASGDPTCDDQINNWVAAVRADPPDKCACGGRSDKNTACHSGQPSPPPPHSDSNELSVGNVNHEPQNAVRQLAQHSVARSNSRRRRNDCDRHQCARRQIG
ncbi:hypothetical protein E3T43_08210 [Cryobacterium sp. Hh7]|uniref:hypothetical protein n=1 Tax=Cryobacterium sp. Hh7 TaxID=1259159 RepID=UPI001069F2FF|nr:hypothetical protein [Cryobacterium sp. Hh7]TFD57465.1 hypothetical protein E3T43_08210 [Cryobacterium sp. Hh7]